MTANQITTPPLLLNASQAADLLSLSRSTFYSLLSRGAIGPRPVRLGRSVRWPAEELRQWVEAGCPPRDKWFVLKGSNDDNL
jgi:excisionase family DNA binding protein